MDIVQTFYDNLASEYDKLFLDWKGACKEQGEFLDSLFCNNGFDKSASVLDCACGIGTQSIGLAALGYKVVASDASYNAIMQAKARAESENLDICIRQADFRLLEKVFTEVFDIVIAMDNPLPHMLTESDLEKAVASIARRVKDGGIFVTSIRDYDKLLEDKPPYSPPYIHNTEKGKRVCFQTWDWSGNHYKLVQYIIEDEKDVSASRFECEYRAFTRAELSRVLEKSGFSEIVWLMPEESGFYQPVVIAKK